jgi:hypothetical protein
MLYKESENHDLLAPEGVSGPRCRCDFVRLGLKVEACLTTFFTPRESFQASDWLLIRPTARGACL